LLALATLRGPAEAGRLARARADADWWTRSRAYEASADLPGGLEILREGVKDPDARVSSFALEKLAASTAPFVVPLLDAVLRDPKASLETVGAAVDAAAERKTLALVDALIAAGKRVSAHAPAEIRDGIKKALLAAADANPAKKAEIVHAMRALPEPKNDEPARFKPLSSSPTLVLDTLKGRIEILLDAKAAPNHAAAIAAQARKGLYDGTIWHRVVTAFVVQGGDPRGSGWGDAGYRLADEINPMRFERGTLGMPKAGPDTGGCQLFISVVPTPHLDGRYTAFGKVLSGLEYIDALEPGDKILKGWIK
jgi:cyclophilin family peptidyl-prolyl cis-trans isomerase